jgi:hypothetical protein
MDGWIYIRNEIFTSQSSLSILPLRWNGSTLLAELSKGLEKNANEQDRTASTW